MLAIIAGSAAGLHHAHERLGLDGKPLGIVHRDVSPSNLMVSYEGDVKVVDFGVAKAALRSTETPVGDGEGQDRVPVARAMSRADRAIAGATCSRSAS